jgi:hypothetical protein
MLHFEYVTHFSCTGIISITCPLRTDLLYLTFPFFTFRSLTQFVSSRPSKCPFNAWKTGTGIPYISCVFPEHCTQGILSLCALCPSFLHVVFMELVSFLYCFCSLYDLFSFFIRCVLYATYVLYLFLMFFVHLNCFPFFILHVLYATCVLSLFVMFVVHLVFLSL